MANNVPASLTNLNNLPTFEELYGMDLIQLAGLDNYDDGGNPAFLISYSDGNEVEYRMLTAQALRVLLDKQATAGTEEAMGTRAHYLYAYADSDGTHKILAFSTKSISPYPSAGNQVDVFFNGTIQSENVHYTFGSSGITLTTAMTASDTVTLRVITADEARGRQKRQWKGSSGSGAGNRTWDLDVLETDVSGNALTKFPSLASRLELYRNGLLCTTQGASPDFSTSGTGTSMIITFTSDIADDEGVTLISEG